MSRDLEHLGEGRCLDRKTEPEFEQAKKTDPFYHLPAVERVQSRLFQILVVREELDQHSSRGNSNTLSPVTFHV